MSGLRYKKERRVWSRTSGLGASSERVRDAKSIAAAAARQRAATKTGTDIGPMPDVQNMKRRERAGKSLRVFIDTYFHKQLPWAWSEDQLKTLAGLEECARQGGQFAYAMSRGGAKTVFARMAVLFAGLYGLCNCAGLIGGSNRLGLALLSGIKKIILGLDFPKLHGDFPEAFYPLRRLEGNARRQIGQHCGGYLTYCTWGREELVFPTIDQSLLPAKLQKAGYKRSPSEGYIIFATSLDSHFRGKEFTRMDGTVVRPKLIVADDPQTRKSARSPYQTQERLELLLGDVLAMAGPGQRMAAFVPCTKIYENDLACQLLDRAAHPEWRGMTFKLVYEWPKRMDLWDKYVNMYRDDLRTGGKGWEVALGFYKEHRAEMDEGAVVGWSERYDRATELSAIQHAINLRFLVVGEEAFMAEYQNEPASRAAQAGEIPKPRQVAERVNGRPRGQIPSSAIKVTGFIDVGKHILFWAVCWWQDGFTGGLVDYGTFPEQGRPFFTADNATRTLGRMNPGMGEDGAILAGLNALTSRLLKTNWAVGGGGTVRLDRLGADLGYKDEVVNAARVRADTPIVIGTRGVGIGASKTPYSMYERRPGWLIGDGWLKPNLAGKREIPHRLVDTNLWKTRLLMALKTAPGDPGAFTLFGKEPKEHDLVAEHLVASEYYDELTSKKTGQTVCEWKQLPHKPDNHWLDCVVGCMALASMEGVKSVAEVERQHLRLTRPKAKPVHIKVGKPIV